MRLSAILIPISSIKYLSKCNIKYINYQMCSLLPESLSLPQKDIIAFKIERVAERW